VIAGRTCEVNKVMVYKRQWMNNNYWIPVQGLSRRLRSPTRPTITPSAPSRPIHRPPQRSTTSTPLLHQPPKQNSCCCERTCVIGSICGFLFVLAFVIGIVVYFLIKK